MKKNVKSDDLDLEFEVLNCDESKVEVTEEDIEKICLIQTCGSATGLGTETSKKTPEEIMEKYNNGKKSAKEAEKLIRSILDMDETKKLPNIILRPEIIKDEELKEDYLQAIKAYNAGMQLTLDAKEEMIIKLDMFIYSMIVSRFTTFKKFTKDLYQEGVLGILKGIDSYDVKKGKPTTYFYIYILHEMTEYINSNINKTTSHYSANIVKVKKAVNRFEHEGREWTIQDIAQETGISAETIMQSLKIMESSKEVHYDTVDYLDSKVNQNHKSPEEEYIKNETAEILHKAVISLPQEEADVISLKFGLTGLEPMSYKNIAENLNIQIDKVRKYSTAGLRKLRNNKTIHGTFNLVKEDRAINFNSLGTVPIETGEKLFDQLLSVEI